MISSSLWAMALRYTMPVRAVRAKRNGPTWARMRYRTSISIRARLEPITPDLANNVEKG